MSFGFVWFGLGAILPVLLGVWLLWSALFRQRIPKIFTFGALEVSRGKRPLLFWYFVVGALVMLYVGFRLLSVWIDVYL